MRRTLRLLLAALGAALALLVVCSARALLARPRAPHVPPATTFELDISALARRLARAIRIPTVSVPGAFDRAPFEALERELEDTFPRAHGVLQVEAVGERARLYRFAGTDPSLPPAVLLAHLDVVPIEEASRAEWKREPFSGDLASACVWGRGTLDDKGSAVAMLEAVELLARRGQTPRRDVWISFGYDEEIGGTGARAVAELLAERGVEPLLVLDEGLFVLEGVFPGLAEPLAAIGVAEKGEVVLALEVELEAGHAAMPPADTAIGVLSRALERLESHRLPSALDAPFSWLLAEVAPRLAFGPRLVLTNTWLTSHLVRRQLSRAPAIDACLRTTTALTMLEGGVAPNVLPRQARAIVDLRVHPRDSVDEVVARVRAIVADERVAFEVLEQRAPSAISPAAGEAYELIERTVLQVFPEACVAPALCIAATDARHFAALTPNVYRFLPLRLGPDDLARVHGIDERVELTSYAEMVRFYAQLLTNL